MSTENYLRSETIHISETNKTAAGSLQWFAENRNKRGSATHPISHNNRLSLYICGEAGFMAIAKDIAEAKESIDVICWGFDPGMELVRTGDLWPRGDTYGDLLIAAGQRGVQVRLLVWCSFFGGEKQHHMPGYTHDTRPWRTQHSETEVQQLNSQGSVELIRAHARINRHKKEWNISPDKLALMAREEYCHSWYEAAFAGRLRGITIRTRTGDSNNIAAALGRERIQPDAVESKLMKQGGTHHQKPILIDFDYQYGQKAIGYVMGLNSVTDYWDTCDHLVENALRERSGAKTLKEQAQGIDCSFDFESLKPYRDYACRIEGGRSLVAIHENFERGWRLAGGDSKAIAYLCTKPPAALLRSALPDDSTVQIVRTQPDEKDFSIKELYFNATRVAATANGYLYLENQYFQYQEWAEHLMDVRERVISKWNESCNKIGKSKEDLPIMYVFIVIPAPEAQQMVPRTYDTLATIGQESGMTGQVKMIKEVNEKTDAAPASPNNSAISYLTTQAKAAADAVTTAPYKVTSVVDTANSIKKLSNITLKESFGIQICVAALNSCEFNQIQRQWRYREIYIHSKLLLVDDCFFTLGSANLNQRSMAVDSEINLASNDIQHCTQLRQRIWGQLAGKENSGDRGTPAEIEKTFRNWVALMRLNKRRQKTQSTDPKKKQMTGFIVPLDDGRSSLIRYG